MLVLHRAEDLELWREAFDFGGLLFERPGQSTKQLRRSPAYRSLLEGLMPSTLPKWWLGHPNTHFALVGIVNRLDRQDMRPGTCGETRLLYRLEHRSTADTRRLPVSMNVVFAQPDDANDCRDVARAWFVEGGDTQALANPGRPLHADRIQPAQLLAIEVNLREDDDGETINRLSVHGYQPDHDRFRRIDFEFELHDVLWKGRGWGGVVRDLTDEAFLEKVRVGTPTIANRYSVEWDTRFIAPSRLPSLLPRALTRTDAAPEDFGPFATVEAAAHRMDTLTCSGCHRQRSVGGFHLPGEGDGSALKGGLSAHLLSELPWRRAYVEAVAAGEDPVRVRKHPHAGPTGFGEQCSLATSPSAALSCADGFSCTPTPGFDFGTCLPESYAGPGPCASGEGCHAPSAWFPGGFATHDCDDEQSCAPVPTPADLHACRTERDVWACAATQATAVRVDSCDDQGQCRDGYACSQVEDRGVCLPVAALPEFRSHGHGRVMR